MADEDIVDRLAVALETNFNKVIKEFSTVESETDKLQSNLSDLESSSKKTSSKVNELGDVFKDASRKTDDLQSSVKDINKQTQEAEGRFKNAERSLDGFEISTEALIKSSDNLSQTLSKEADSIKETGTQSEKAGRKVKEAGDQANDAEGDFSGLNDVIGKVTGAFSVLAAADFISQVVGQLIVVQDGVKDLSTNFETLYQNTDLARDSLKKYADAVASTSGSSVSERGSTEDAILQTFGKDGEAYFTDEFNRDLLQAVTNVSTDTGLSGNQLVYKLYEIMEKWSLNEEQAVEYLNQLYGISKSQKGDRGENLADNLNALLEYDWLLLEQLEFTYDETLAFMEALGRDYKSASESFALIEREQMAATAELGKIPDKIAQLEKSIDDARTKRYEIELEGGDTSGIDAEIETYKIQIKDLQKEASKTAGEVVRQTLETAYSQPTAEFYGSISGRQKDEYRSISQNLETSKGYNVSQYFNKGSLTNREMSWQEQMGATVDPELAVLNAAKAEVLRQEYEERQEELALIEERIQKEEELAKKYGQFMDVFYRSDFAKVDKIYGERGAAELGSPSVDIRLAYARYILGEITQEEINQLMSEYGFDLKSEKEGQELNQHRLENGGLINKFIEWFRSATDENYEKSDELVKLEELEDNSTESKGLLFTLIDKLTEVNDSIRSLEPTTNNNVTVNQTINSTAPLDSAKIRQETERAATVAGKIVFTH